MTIGTLPPGLNKQFVLPFEVNIPSSMINTIVTQISKDNQKNAPSNSEGQNGNATTNSSDTNQRNVPDRNININYSTPHGISRLAPRNIRQFINNNINSNLASNSISNHNNTNTNNNRNKSTNKNKNKSSIWYPLIIVLEALECEPNKNNSSLKYQATLVNMELSGEDNHYVIKSIEQKVMIKSNLYKLEEVYGFTDIANADPLVPDDVNTSDECVICLSEQRDTIVLPCRHLCICQDCADILSNQARQNQRNNYLSTPKCPICRQVFHSLLRINLDYFNSVEDTSQNVLSNETLNQNMVNENNSISKQKLKEKNVENTDSVNNYNIIASYPLNDDEIEPKYQTNDITTYQNNLGSTNKNYDLYSMEEINNHTTTDPNTNVNTNAYSYENENVNLSVNTALENPYNHQSNGSPPLENPFENDEDDEINHTSTFVLINGNTSTNHINDHSQNYDTNTVAQTQDSQCSNSNPNDIYIQSEEMNGAINSVTAEISKEPINNIENEK